MSDILRRVVLKPAGLGGDQLAQLAVSLRAAVEFQSQLAARSPHVLQFVGGLQETEQTFFVEHEPARPLGMEDLFNPGSPLADEKTLLRMAAALFDALQVTHGMPGDRPSVHGGLCPGTLLISADGIEKVSDFGFAPALCAAVGPEAYVNLAVGPRTEGLPECLGTGVWEVLAPEVTDRDDRICSFIDPEKYGTRHYQSFEPKSDVVAAGFILHLLAEHRHPYFHDDPGAHRMVEVAEYMAMSTGTRARRKDLRESENPAVRLWCELVDKMIDRLPQNRPSASALASELGQYQRPVGPEEMVQRRFEALLHRLEAASLAEIQWDEVVAEAAAIVEAPAAPSEVSEQAGALVRLGQAGKALSGSGWREAAGPLAELSTTARLPASLTGKLEEARQVLDRNLAAQETLDRIEADLHEGQRAEPAELAGFIASLQERLDSLRTTAGLVGEIRERIEHKADDLAARHQEALLGAERLESIARDWLAALQAAAQAGQWDAVEQRLAERPRLSARLPDLAAQAAEVEHQLRHRQELLGQIRESEARLADGQIPEARRLAQNVERQEAHPDLAEQARELNSRIDDQERRLREEQRRIEEARARVDELLARAEQGIARDTWAGLEEAKARAAEAMDVPEISPAQQARAQSLLDSVAKRMKGLLAEARLGVEALRRAEVDLEESRQLLEAGQLLAAEAKVEPHTRSDFPNIQEEAEQLAAQIADRRRAEESRLKAVADRDEALAVLREGDLPTARAFAEQALGSAHIEPEVRADAQRVLTELPALEAAKGFMDREDFPRALEVLQAIPPAAVGPIAPSVRAGAERLMSQARQLRREKLLDSICGHLVYRARREEESPQVATVPPDESLPSSALDWVRRTLTDFETFLQDCGVAGGAVLRGETLPAGERLGERYEVLEFLGRGGMGEVYRARDLSLDREVALKLARPTAESGYLVEALRNEAKAIAALKHPHIIHINNFEVIGDRPCFDTNYIRGRDLDQHASGHTLTWRQMAEILIPIADALAYAHRQGVLHRDVKPQNIYLGERPGEGPWLIDFGLARMRSICDRRANTGLCGTPGYIAPEVIASMGEDVDHRADIFGLGCVLYRLLAKEVPFRRGEAGQTPSKPSVSRTLLNTLRTQLTPLSQAAPDSPEVLRRICERAMAHEPRDRYQDAEQVARDLRRFLVLLDRRDAEAAIAQARASFAGRPQGELAELEALDRILAQAEAARNLAERSRRRAEQILEFADDRLNRATEEVKRQAAGLIEEVRQVKQQIVDSQAQANSQLQAAGTAVAARRYRVALRAAREVLVNPYVPDLHEQAREIAAQAERHVRETLGKFIKMGAVASGTLLCALVVYWYFFLMPFAPRIVRSPADAVARIAESVTFEVKATARPKPTYQWQKKTNGVWDDLPGKTQATLTIGPVRQEDAGEYQCLVRNDRGAKWAGVTLSIEATQHELSTEKQGEGTVEVSPAGGPYAKGTEVTLTATPADGWRFDRWDGLPAGSKPTTKVTMDQDRTVTAVFVQVRYTLTTEKQGEGTVDVSPADGPYAKGTEVTLKATPAEGWQFDRWDGLPAGSQPIARLTMDQDQAVTAVFVQVRYTLTTEKQGEGTVEVLPAGGPYAKGTEVTLKATPAEGWRFDHWDGLPAGSQPIARLTMDQDQTVTAVFVQVRYTLTARKQGEGTVEVSPANGPYAKGTEVTLKATPADGWRFDRWEGVPAGTQPTARLTMDQDQTVTAVFVQLRYALTTEKQGEGTVEVLPAGGPYAKGTEVTLKATPADGWQFDRWDGLPAGSQPTARLTMDQDQTVTAVFIQLRYALTTEKQGEGTVEVLPAGGPYAKGTEVTVKATPADGWRFDRWDGLPAGSKPTTKVTMDQDRTVTALFVQLRYALTTEKQGEGTVEVLPAGGPYAKGTEVTLKATPAEGWQFDRWDGLPAGSQPTARLTMDQDQTVTAVFVQLRYALSAEKQGEGSIQVSLAGGAGAQGSESVYVDAVTGAIVAGPYAKGTEITLTATPADGWRFERWVGLPANSGQTVKLVMDQDRTLEAVFAKVTTPDIVPRPAGWAGLDEAMEKKIAGLLVSPENGESPVRGLDSGWIGFDRKGAKLDVSLTYPWAAYGWAVTRQLTLSDVPFPGDSWPQSADEQPASAAAAITVALQEKAGADLLVNSVLRYLGFWKERAVLEKELIAKLPAGSSGPVSLDPGEVGGKSGHLTRLARIKWMSGEVPDTPPIGEWTRRLQDVLRGNHGKVQIPIQVLPTRFIEYFWGPEFVHAVYWSGDGSESSAVRYVRLGPSAEIGQKVMGFVRDKTLSADLGEQLLGPIIRDADPRVGGLPFFAVTDPGNTFGIALAPDGPLCLVPLLKLAFEPLAVEMSVPDAAIISNIPKRLSGKITQFEALYTGPFESAHTAAWVLASLAGAPPAAPAPTPTELWEAPCAMVTDQRLAPSQTINDYGRAFNAQVVCFRSDRVAVTAALQRGIRRVDSLFNMGAGGESFDAGFLYPRMGEPQAPWFVMVGSPVRLSQ